MYKEHIKELDVLRMIGFIFVVAQHILGGYAWREGAGFTESLILNLFYVIAQPAVPIFIVITSISLFYNYSERMNVLNYYKKRFLYIFLPYVIWTVLNILDTKQYDQVSINHLIGELAAGTGRYHLWYMSMVLRIYLLFPLILWPAKQILKTSKPFKVSFFIVFSILYLILLKNNGITTSVGEFIFGTPTINEQRFLDRTPLLWSIYFLLGAYVIFGLSNFKSWLQRGQKQILLAYLPLLLYNYYFSISPHLPGHIYISAGYIYCLLKVSYMILSIFIFYNLSCYVSEQKPRLYRLFKETSPFSYSSYLGHVIVLQAVAMKLQSIFPIKSFLVSGLIIFLLTVVLTVKLVELLSILPFSRYFLGTKYKYEPKILSRGIPL